MGLAKGTIGVVAVVVVAAGAYWLHERARQPQPALASAPEVRPAEPPPISRDPAPEPAAVAAPRAVQPADPKKVAAPTPDPGMPLRTGEILDYTADVAKVSNVANLRLQVAERRNFLGKTAWHLQAFAHTENPLRMVFELDDQFDSYSDAGTLASLQYEMHLSERGQKVDSVQRMTATGRDPAPPNAGQTRVLPGTRDPLGMMQYLRHVDWSKTHEVRGPVYDGHKLYDVRASLAGASQSLAVPAGTYTADKVEIRVFDDGAEMKDAHLFVYFAHNESRTPVLLEAEMPFASARVALKSVR
ncbi:MAG: DUF3108 domain-containing protein [Candidatus Acidiferrum sp.]|jgi:uncharacterized protein DUF3108